MPNTFNLLFASSPLVNTNLFLARVYVCVVLCVVVLQPLRPSPADVGGRIAVRRRPPPRLGLHHLCLCRRGRGWLCGRRLAGRRLGPHQDLRPDDGASRLVAPLGWGGGHSLDVRAFRTPLMNDQSHSHTHTHALTHTCTHALTFGPTPADYERDLLDPHWSGVGASALGHRPRLVGLGIFHCSRLGAIFRDCDRGRRASLRGHRCHRPGTVDGSRGSERRGGSRWRVDERKSMGAMQCGDDILACLIASAFLKHAKGLDWVCANGGVTVSHAGP